MFRPIALATAVAGLLDIGAAIVLTLLRGRDVPDMLRSVASGPFPQATGWSDAGALLGLLVHFTLMGVMAAAFVIAASRIASLRAQPLRWGVIFGLLTYVVMNLIVVPLRWPSAFPPSLLSVTTQLFCHVVLVGMPIAWIAARYLPARARA